MTLPAVHPRGRRARSNALPVRAPAGLVVPGGLTLGDSYELVGDGGPRVQGGTGGGLLRLARRRNFPAAVADAKATPPASWTWLNSAENFTSAIAGNLIDCALDAAETNDWWGATTTAPYLYRTYSRVQSGRTLSWIARISVASFGADWEFLGLLAADPANNATWARIVFARDSVQFPAGSNRGLVTQANSATYQTVQLSGTEHTDGVWIRLDIEPDGTVRTYYSAAVQTTPPAPSGWTALGLGTGAAATWASALRSVRVGWLGGKTHAASSLTGRLHYYDDSYSRDGSYWSRTNPDYGGQGYDATTPAILLGDWDLGDYRAILTTSEIRARLAERVNVLPDDAATWTFSLTRGPQGATPAPATTYQSAAALDVKTGGTDTVTTTGRRAALRGRCASSGTQAGSLDLAGLGFGVLL